MKVLTFSREEFLAERWHYKAGEHVSIIGPTGAGKTYLNQQLLEVTARPTLPAIVLVSKPKDETILKWNKKVNYRVVTYWPPRPTIFGQRKPSGYILWPKHTYNPDLDNQRLWLQFRRVLLDSYKRGNRIIAADEVYELVEEMKLKTELVALWSRGRSQKTGLWSATQRPAMVPLWMYNCAEHLFLSYDPDKRSVDRFKEIGGIDPNLVKETVMNLEKYQWLYIKRSERAICVVDK